jgi:MFS family permease
MVVEQASEQVLPATYLFLGRALDASPSQLGLLTLSRAMVQTLASPLSGLLGTFYDRSKVLSAGAVLWGLMTAALAGSTSLRQAAFFAAINGFGLALLVPCACSLTADLFPASARGRAFGAMTLTGAMGGMLGGLFATNVGARGDVSLPWPLSALLAGVFGSVGGGEGGAATATTPTIEGWRLAYLAVAVVSVAVGLLVLAYARDPRPGMRGGGGGFGGGAGAGTEELGLGEASAGEEDVLWVQGGGAEDDDPSKQHPGLLSVVVAGGSGSGGSAAAPTATTAPLLSAPASSAGGSPLAAKHRRAAAAAAARVRSPALQQGASSSSSPDLRALPSPPPPHSAAAVSAAARLKRRRLAQDVVRVLRIPTFQVIIAQGVVGSFPWQALVFLLLWLQLLGFSDASASSLVAVFQFGVAVGGLLGGAVADRAARRFPERGRVAVAQFSVFSGLPLVFLLFKGLPAATARAAARAAAAAAAAAAAGAGDGSGGLVPPPVAITAPSPWPYGCCLLLLGLLCSWCGAGVNSPIFAELVPDDLRSTIYAFDRSFENALAACAAPVVGFIAERRFGFSGKLSDQRAMNDPLVRAGDAAALGSSLLLCTSLPWVACLTFYTALYSTYPRDRRKARAWAEERAAALAGSGSAEDAALLPATAGHDDAGVFEGERV